MFVGLFKTAKMHYTLDKILDARLSKIESLLAGLQQASPSTPTNEVSHFGDFNWYIAETGEAPSSARQRISRDEVPGVTRLGKRLLFEKAVVRQWIRDNQRKTAPESIILAQKSFDQRLTARRNK